METLFVQQVRKQFFCLNRTMQYGNYELSKIEDENPDVFKSYYVVWKLIFLRMTQRLSRCLNRTMQYGNIKKRSKSLFFQKSLNRTMQYGNIASYGTHLLRFISFKSYYVVWKPQKALQNSQIDKGLNRTMQYGNGYDISAYDPASLSLNRTMQYGNFSLLV